MTNESSIIGAKTLRLFDLQKLQLNVPKFTYIEAYKIDHLGKNTTELEKIATKIHHNFNCDLYAVRSSALIEDSEAHSLAGQFKTIINVKPENLCQAISEIIQHADKYLKGKLKKFSVLIQEYIEADFAGITFTRNPLGSREMTLEYHHGIGEDIVSGKVLPEKIAFYWNQKIDYKKLPQIEKAIENFKKIESFFKKPQDIEWCIKNDNWYFLQTRPITGISAEKYREFLYLDEILPKDQKFYFAKTEISEIAPRPTPFTLSLLKKIYGQGGPIENVYKKYGISYTSRNFLKIIGNELFVDKEEELKSLLPAYSYINDQLEPHFAQFSGLFKTLKNIYRLNKIDSGNHNILFEKIKAALENENGEKDLSSALKTFSQNYELIFEANLLAGITLSRLKKIFKESSQIADILSQQTILNKKKSVNFSGKGLIGNALEINDKNEFISNLSNGEGNKKNVSIENQTIYEAIIYNYFRELGRWLTVKNINKIRKLLLEIGKIFKNPELVYFASIEKILKNKSNEDELIKRKKEYDSFNSFTLPNELTHKPISNKQKLTVVSTGKIEGILVTEEMLNKKEHQNKDKILYTKMLSPELTKYFPEIKGIVSEQGGLLSHLAIMCREYKIPAITGCKLEENNFKIGDFISI